MLQSRSRETFRINQGGQTIMADSIKDPDKAIKLIWDAVVLIQDRLNRKEGSTQHNTTMEEWIEDLDKLMQRHSREISTLENEVISLLKENKKMNDAINIGAANYVEVKEKIENITYFLKKKFPGEFL